MSTDMFPDSFIQYCLENPMPEDAAETCTECGKAVKVQIMKNTGLCGEACRKQRDGETDKPKSQTDAGITNLLGQRNPGGINLNGIH